MATWGKPETLKLIDLWADDKVQEELEGCHHNRDIYQHIAMKLQEAELSNNVARKLRNCARNTEKLRTKTKKLDRVERIPGHILKSWMLCWGTNQPRVQVLLLTL